jgi:putative ABC transport system permease protein
MFSSNAVDENYFKTFDIKLIQGRFFEGDVTADSKDQFILNECAVKYMKLDNPIGVKIGRGDEFSGEVVGVVKDFHFKSLHEKIDPLVLSMKSNGYMCMSFKINTGDMVSSLDIIKTKFNQVIPDKPFVYSFFDEDFSKMYEKETKFARIISTFSFLSIFIACLGLIGLVTFAIEKKKKEISIRKVLGAEIKNIIYLVSKEFLLLIVIANIIAMPVAYYGMSKWLDDFAYKTELSWWIFILSILVSVAISIITIGSQTFKAAVANPVDSLRSE